MKKERLYTREEVLNICRMIFTSIATVKDLKYEFVEAMLRSVNDYLDDI
jgi:hypothetical protein